MPLIEPPGRFLVRVAEDHLGVLAVRSPAEMVRDAILAAVFHRFLRPIINMVKAPLFVAANKDVPANSLSELIELGRKDPESLSFGTSGNATPHRMVGELLKQMGGFEMMHVPYKGTSAAVTNLAGGQIPLVIGGAGSLLPLVQAGRI